MGGTLLFQIWANNVCPGRPARVDTRVSHQLGKLCWRMNPTRRENLPFSENTNDLQWCRQRQFAWVVPVAVVFTADVHVQKFADSKNTIFVAATDSSHIPTKLSTGRNEARARYASRQTERIGKEWNFSLHGARCLTKQLVKKTCPER